MMKRLLLVLAGVVAGMVHAQTVDWNNAYLSSCSSEVREFEADYRSSWQRNRDFEVSRYLSPPLTEAKLRERLGDFQGHIAGGHNSSSTRMNICVVNAALRQLQTTSSASVPAASAVPDPTAQEGIRGCLKQDSAKYSLINQCNVRISLSWCAVPHIASDSSNQHCESQRFSSHELSPGDSVRVDEDALIASLACPAPRRPVDLKYVRGTGLTGRCVR